MDIITFKNSSCGKTNFYKAIVNFLIDLDVYDDYIKEVTHQHPNFNLQTHVFKTGGYDLINTTLCWANTQAGSDFWLQISRSYTKWWIKNAPKYKNSLPPRTRDRLD